MIFFRNEVAMENRIRILYGFVVLCVIVLASCATTKLTTVWKDATYHGTIKRIVVVGAFKQPSIRNLFEDAFVRRLKSLGVDAVASYTIVPIEELTRKDFLMAEIRRTWADAALVTRLVDRKTVETYVPGEVYAFPNYYHHWGRYFDYIYQPGYMAREEYAYAETNVYDTKDERLIWAARSQTLLYGDSPDLIKAFVTTMTDEMVSDQLIR